MITIVFIRVATVASALRIRTASVVLIFVTSIPIRSVGTGRIVISTTIIAVATIFSFAIRAARTLLLVYIPSPSHLPLPLL